MGASVWIGTLTTLAGAALGGVISFAVSRQQIKAAREQRAEGAVHEDRRWIADRRLAVYSDFLTQVRTYRNAVRAYFQTNGKGPAAGELDNLLRSANDASAAVFLLAGTLEARDACAAILRAIGETQLLIHSADESQVQADRWPEISSLLAGPVHHFQDAAKDELAIGA